MSFHGFIVDYLQKRKAEKEAKGKSLHGLLVLLFGSVGALIGTLAGLSLPLFGLALQAVFPLTVSLSSIVVLGFILLAHVIVWPRFQRYLAETDDNYNYLLYLREHLAEVLAEIRKLKVSPKTRARLEEEAYVEFLMKYKEIQRQIELTRIQRRDGQRVFTEMRELRAELTRQHSEMRENVNREALNPASVSGIVSTADMIDRPDKARL